MSKKGTSSSSKASWMFVETGSTWTRAYALLKGHDLSLYASDQRDEEPVAAHDLDDATVAVPDPARVTKRFAIELVLRHGGVVHLCAESREEAETWLMALSSAAVSEGWPGGVDPLTKRPQPLLYSLWIANHTPAGSGSSSSASGLPSSAAASSSAAAFSLKAGSGAVPSPMARYKHTLLKSAPPWQRRALLLQKLRLCSVVFDGVDPSATAYDTDREIKRNTLLEVLEYADAQSRSLFSDLRVLDDTFTMIKLNLFRTLPVAPEPSGDPDVEEEPFEDPQWAHLNIVYELLLRLVSSDHIDLALRKRVVDVPFVRQLILLFDSEDPRERDYLKTIMHRVYSKLTQRRSLIRKAICNIFFEFIFESEKHNGIAEMLEVLASIINGFALPIKEEHRMMLMRALLPLHKAANIAPFHPQLSYCIALYVAKDHTLTRDVIPGLLKIWPFGNSQKQIMFLNELEDIFDYVQEDDLHYFLPALCARIAKCVGGLHFQVAERCLLLWNAEHFSQLMLVSQPHRAAALPLLYPVLAHTREEHWHGSIRTLSHSVLEHYQAEDPALLAQCAEEEEQKYAAMLAAESAAASASASAHSSGLPSADASPSHAAASGGLYTGTGGGSGPGTPMAAGGAGAFSGAGATATAAAVEAAYFSPQSSGVGGVAGSGSGVGGGVGLLGSGQRTGTGTGSPFLSTPPTAYGYGYGYGTVPPGSGGGGGSGGGPGSGHALRHPATAPVVRAGAAFTVSDNADGLGLPHVTPKRRPMSLPVSLPPSEGVGNAEIANDE